MKKIALILSCMFGFAYADFNTNFAKSIKDLSGVEVKVEFKKELESFKDTYFVIAKTSNGDAFPVFVSKDGKYLIGFSNVLSLADNDMKMMQEQLKKASEANIAKDKQALSKLFASFAKEDFVYLEGNKKGLPTKIVVTAPDCPHCQNQLKNDMDKILDEANLKIIFAPLGKEDAFIKAQLIMNETKNLKSTKEKLAVLRKYYFAKELSKTQLKTNYDKVKANQEKIFGSGLVQGVPFVFSEE
ncbi:thiol peroxidase [Helicobacter burdigaliensis]|uniref:thiol peroxidase n=1 Tax=Helicobacter burdigaliensis TaxID=2315334 RepID=UPI000EF6C791|nr:thiol peroxidase [Helicobacter burdigaliensis]